MAKTTRTTIATPTARPYFGAALTGSACDSLDRAQARLLVLERALCAARDADVPEFLPCDPDDARTVLAQLVEDVAQVRAEIGRASRLADAEHLLLDLVAHPDMPAALRADHLRVARAAGVAVPAGILAAGGVQ